MDTEDERTDSFPLDGAYPSRSTRSHIRKHSIGDSLRNNRHIQRKDTGDFEPRRRLRHTITLRSKTNSPKDEEKGYSEEKANGLGYSTSRGIDQKTSSGSAAVLQPKSWEIISTKCVPDEEGREKVTLTVKDEGENPDQENVCCKSRWTHIPSDAITFKKFSSHVNGTPGLGDDDVALVGRLLEKVRKTSEKKFVHGRYLKPITLVYDGVDPKNPASPRPEDKVRKTATFVSFPFFTIGCPQRHTLDKKSEGHPVRALVQSRYHLESTKRRDKEQVITKAKYHSAHKDHVVHVPQIWALIINSKTIITCAALDASVLRGDTIELMMYTAAQLDEATWSVHLTDARGRDFYPPLRSCKTWFDLVKQITDNCLDAEYKFIKDQLLSDESVFQLVDARDGSAVNAEEWSKSFIRDQLLNDGPVYHLVDARDASAVNAERWSKLVEETKTEVIHLRLVNNESVSRFLVAYYDDEGNEGFIDSDESSDTSPIFSSDDGEESDASVSISSDTNSENNTRAISRLRSLQAEIREAESKGDAKKVKDLKEHKIPAREKKLLEMTAAGLDLEKPIEKQARRRSKIIISGPCDPRPRSGRGIDLDSPLSPTKRYRARIRSRSRSTSGTRVVNRGAAFSDSTYDLSIEEPFSHGQRIIHDRNHSDSRSRYFKNVNYDVAPRSRPRTLSHMPNAYPLSEVSTLPIRSRSGWDLIRSRVRDRQLPDLRSGPISPTTDCNDIYYRPSEKQLARSYWDLVRSSVREGGIQRLRNAESAKKNEGVTDQAELSTATATDKPKKGLSRLNRISDVLDASPTGSATVSPTTMDPPASFGPPNSLHIPANDVSGVSHGENDLTKPKNVLFSKHSLESKSKLNRLIKLAQKGSAESRKTTSSLAAFEARPPVVDDPTIALPIFLWPTEHKQFESGDLTRKYSKLSKSSPQKSYEKIKQVILTSKKEELILHTVMAEVHIALKKPDKSKPEYAKRYEQTAEKTHAGVASSMNAMRTAKNGVTDLTVVDEREISNPSDQDDMGSIKFEIFDLAREILLAFVPKGYDAPVILKYWGALHKLLIEKVRPPRFLRQACTDLSQDEAEADLQRVRSRLSEICSLIQSIQMGVRAKDGSKPQQYQIPGALRAAFQHLVLWLVVIGSISKWSDDSKSQMQSTFDDCEDLLVQGRMQLLSMIHTDDFRGASGFQAVDSEALLSLILANLSSTLSTEGDFHLTEVYADYTTRIQAMVRDSASVKVRQPQSLLA